MAQIGTSRLGRFLTQQSYAVYVIHVPLIVFMAYALYVALSQRGIDFGGIHFGPLLKFGILSVIVVPICFVIAWLICKMPVSRGFFNQNMWKVSVTADLFSNTNRR